MEQGCQEGLPMDGHRPSAKPWWREIQVAWLLALVGGIYFARIGDLNLRGEETRRAQVAQEMLWNGDWLIPRQQGEFYVTRPPLGTWAIAVSAKLRGELDAVAARLPSVMAVLLTVLLIYGYARSFLSKTEAFLAAAAYPTMVQVLQLGRTAETEALFTLWMSGSLMVWHWGYLKKWPAWRMWSAGYFLAALAGLTKGPQGIAYFVGPVGVYLLFVKRDWRMLLRPAHAFGILIGLSTLALWQVPYTMATSLAAGKTVWFNQAVNRYSFWDPNVAVKHYLKFPLEILACTCPWSLAFVQIFNRNCWRSLKPVWPQIKFLLVALAVTFPTVWFAPYARGRYFMPMYPLIGVFCAIVIERSAAAKPPGWLYNGWRQYIGGLAAALVLAGIAVCGISVKPEWASGKIMIPIVVAIAFLIASLGFAVWVFRTFRSGSSRAIQITVGGLVAMLGFAYVGLVHTAEVARQRDAAQIMASVRAGVPHDARLESFGRIQHAFTYHYGEYIPQRPWPVTADDPSLPAYFCVRLSQVRANPLPFAWEKLAEVTFEDDEFPSATSWIIVGRRLPGIAAAPTTGPN